ncbi:MAG: polyprenyl synthetase family protein [Acidobacteriaceae bacterium]
MTILALARHQERYAAALQRSIRAALTSRTDPDRFYDIMAYQFGYVDTTLRPASGQTGKQFRPTLCLLACEAVGGTVEQALQVATAVELLHNFSLIHDDIEDDDLYRRHQPTIWNVWGKPQAINVGDGMFALAGAIALDSAGDPGRTLELARRFQNTARALTEGQYLDMCFESRLHVRADAYLQMISRKSAALIAYALWAGAWSGGADIGTSAALESFGMDLGRAFQIYDDIMGVWGDKKDTGKTPAKDLISRKKSLPILLAIEAREALDGDVLLAFLERRSDDFDAAHRALDDPAIKSRCISMLNEHLDRALMHLAAAGIREQEQNELERISRELVGQV